MLTKIFLQEFEILSLEHEFSSLIEKIAITNDNIKLDEELVRKAEEELRENEEIDINKRLILSKNLSNINRKQINIDKLHQKLMKLIDKAGVSKHNMNLIIIFLTFFL